MPRRKTPTQRRRHGVFITLEGIEGSGKTTQLARLSKYLREKGYRVVETREPGGTPLAEQIRAVMLDLPAYRPSEHSIARLAELITPECEAALVLAARVQHVTHVIHPALRENAIVLCDRFSDSTLAYQGYARGLDVRTLRKFNGFATRGLTPDLTLLFDLPVEKGLTRRRHATEQNRLDRETRQFHNRVRHGFLDLAAHQPHRIKVIDAAEDPDRIAINVAAIVNTFLGRVEKSHRPKVIKHV